MSVTKNEVKHIAKLAKLQFNDEEIVRYTDDLNKILEYVDKLNELWSAAVGEVNPDEAKITEEQWFQIKENLLKVVSKV